MLLVCVRPQGLGLIITLNRTEYHILVTILEKTCHVISRFIASLEYLFSLASSTLCQINLKTRLCERKRNKCFASTHENGTNVLRSH